MTVMHEDVHERTRQKQQEGQRTEKVDAMLAEQKIGGHGTHDDKAHGIS
jgi:hypothetical protein